jgi:TonB family protein
VPAPKAQAASSSKAATVAAPRFSAEQRAAFAKSGLKVLGADSDSSIADVLKGGSSGVDSLKGLGGVGLRGSGSSGAGSGYGSGAGGLGAHKERGISLDSDAAAVEVEGSLDRELIRRIIRQHANQVRYCYEKQLQLDPSLQGKIVVGFVIGAEGNVTSATIEQSTLSSPAVGQCVVERVKTWIFPMPKGGIVKVAYPFTFKNAENP